MVQRPIQGYPLDPIPFLKGFPLFSVLNDPDIQALAEATVIRTFPKNNIIIYEGDTSTSLYIILKGHTHAVCLDDDGKQLILNEFCEGDFFGEMSFLDGSPRCASVITRTVTQVMIIRREAFTRLMDGNPELSRKLIYFLLDKLRGATRKIRELVFLDAYGRVLLLLKSLAGEAGFIDIKLTHQDIADRVGTSREMVSRIIKELIAGRYISRKKKCITILRDFPQNW